MDASSHDGAWGSGRGDIVRDKPCILHWAGAGRRGSGGDAPAAARKPRGRGARPGGGDPQFTADRPGRDGAGPPGDGRGRDPRGRARADREVQRAALGGPRLRARLDAQPGAPASPRRNGSGDAALRAAGLEAPLLERRHARAPERHRAKQERPVRPVAPEHLRGLADRAGAGEPPGQPRDRAADAPSARLLEAQGGHGRPGHLERGSDELSTGPAGRDHRARRRGRRERFARPTWGHLRAAERAAHRGGQDPPADGGQSDRHRLRWHAPRAGGPPVAGGAAGQKLPRHPGGAIESRRPTDRAPRPRRVERARRLHPRRPGVCHPHLARRANAGALGQRAREPVLWHRGQRERQRVHMVRKRPRPSPDPVEQRRGLRRER